MLVPIFPPMGICIGLMVMSYKRRYLFGEQRNSERKSGRRSESGLVRLFTELCQSSSVSTYRGGPLYRSVTCGLKYRPKLDFIRYGKLAPVNQPLPRELP